MKNYKYIKLDTIIVCELQDDKELIYQDNFHSIYNKVNNSIYDDITLLFLIENKNKEEQNIISKKITPLEKELILLKKISNFELFDFIFFNYILEKENKINNFEQNEINKLTEIFEQFIQGLNTYRQDTIKHKTFHIKQRRISRKQLENMKMNFKKWEQNKDEEN